MTEILATVVGFALAVLGWRVFRDKAPAERAPVALRRLLQNQEESMGKLDDIIASVQELTTINDSLDAVFAKLQELIQQGQGGDPTKFEEALALLSSEKERTKAAIVANTPAGP